MNRAELHNIPGFHPPTLIAAVAHLRATLPRSKGLTETTAIVRNEGRMNGYLDALDDLLAAAAQQPPKTEKAVLQPYSQPALPTENQNKP